MADEVEAVRKNQRGASRSGHTPKKGASKTSW